jgi:BNR/Asp-box repeat
VIVTNVDFPAAGLFEGVSFDGGTTWARSLIGNNDNLGAACCDPTLSFDSSGNLFMSYLLNMGATVPVAFSKDGGMTFTRITPDIAKPAGSASMTANERKGLFRFTDQPTITTGHGEVWVVFNAGGPIAATGATAASLLAGGAFPPVVVVPGTNNCTYGDVAIGPTGAVMNVCTLTETGTGGGRLFVSLNPTGVGGSFGKSTFVTDSHVGGFDFIPAQPDRSVDAEPGLAWDRTGMSHNGRLYLVYTFRFTNQDNNTDIFTRYSDDRGATWSAPVRVNDDATKNSQFLPKISLDPTTGNLAVVWYDSRNDLGLGGPGDTDGIPNDDAQFWGAFSIDGGQSFRKNFQISAGTSNSHDAMNGIDFGDYTGLSFFGGIAHPVWADNSNSTGTNPDGALHQLDDYTAAVSIVGR